MHTVLYLHDVLFRIKRDTRGAVGTEYALLIVFIAIVAAIGMVVMGTELAEYFIAYGNAFLAAGDAVNPS